MVPSSSEGFCFVAAESIAMNIPVISSGKGALAEVVSGTHITMKSYDSKGLQEALEKAYRGEWDKTEVKKFPLDDTVDNYIGLYRELV